LFREIDLWSGQLIAAERLRVVCAGPYLPALDRGEVLYNNEELFPRTGTEFAARSMGLETFDV
jgi:hypothetical protein